MHFNRKLKMNKELLIKSMQDAGIHCRMISDDLWQVNNHEIKFNGAMVEIENVKARFRNAENLLWIMRNSEILYVSKTKIIAILKEYRELIY